MQPLPRATNDVSPGGCAWELVDASIPFNWFLRRKLRGHRRGLSVPQFRTLVLVSNRPTTSLSALSDHLEVSLPNASRIVSGLVAKRLLTRAGCPNDRRQMSLQITGRGQDVLVSAWSAAQNELADELKSLSAEQRKILIQSMSILKGIFGSLHLPRGSGELAAAPAKVSRRLVVV